MKVEISESTKKFLTTYDYYLSQKYYTINKMNNQKHVSCNTYLLPICCVKFIKSLQCLIVNKIILIILQYQQKNFLIIRYIKCIFKKYGRAQGGD